MSSLAIPLLVLLALLTRASCEYEGGEYEDYLYPDNVVRLSNKNFKDLVLRSNYTWVVGFYATWCIRSHELMPEFLKVADNLEGLSNLRVGAVDTSKGMKLANKFNVADIPTVLIFGKNKSDPIEYKGTKARTLVRLVVRFAKGEKINWLQENERAEDHATFSRSSLHDTDVTISQNKRSGITSVTYTKMLQMTEPLQLINANSFLENCEEANLCIIAFLPNLTACPSPCRKEYLVALNGTKKDFQEEWSWMWTEGGVQNELEAYLHVKNAEYPVLTVFQWTHKRTAMYQGEFTREKLRQFLNDLHQGKGDTVRVRYKKLPDIQKTEKWRDEL